MSQELVRMDDWYKQIIHALRETKHTKLADDISGEDGREDRQRRGQVVKEGGGDGGGGGGQRRNEGGRSEEGQGGGTVRSVENGQRDQEEREHKVQNSERLNSSK